MAVDTFEGFPQQAFTFLKNIEKNNNKEWFEAHKQDYIAYVQQPALAFVATLGERLRKKVSGDIIYDLRTNGAGSLMRIYRDTRFSKDKTPYKDHVGMILWEGEGKKMENSGFYVGFDKEGGGVHAGYHGFPKSVLAAFRDAVDDETEGKGLEKIIKNVEAAGYEINGEQYKTVPRGYDKDHPRAALMKYGALWASSPRLTPDDITSPALIDIAYEHCLTMAPIHKWLVALSANA